MGIDTTKAINVGAFTSGQKQFLDFHRNAMLRNLSAASTRGRTAARNHPNREQHSKDVRSGSHNRLKSDIARCPFCAAGLLHRNKTRTQPITLSVRASTIRSVEPCYSIRIARRFIPLVL